MKNRKVNKKEYEKTRIALGLPCDFDPQKSLTNFLNNEDPEFKSVILDHLKNYSDLFDSYVILLDDIEKSVL